MLTPNQIAVLTADIPTHPELAAARDGRQDQIIADFYNAVDGASTTNNVWKTNVPTVDIVEAITWANLTPVDAPDGTQLWMNRAMACELKQMNLQNLLFNRTQIDGSRPNIRQAFTDALTAIPSGIAGANQTGGAANVIAKCKRLGNRLEALLATGTGTVASPKTMVFEGSISSIEIGGCY